MLAFVHPIWASRPAARTHCGQASGELTGICRDSRLLGEIDYLLRLMGCGEAQAANTVPWLRTIGQMFDPSTTRASFRSVRFC